ncbi:hypothetical protein COCCADRAFT_98926, partial [Bipolaris zeicola 26-R-13]
NTASRLTRSGTLALFFCFLVFNVVFLLDGRAISSLSQWHAMTLTNLTRSTFTNLPTWTDIECQLDMPRGDDKSYTCICDAAVIARLCLLKGN